MHRKRLLKQIETAYDLFKIIRPHEDSEVLKEYQNIDIKLDKERDTLKGNNLPTHILDEYQKTLEI